MEYHDLALHWLIDSNCALPVFYIIPPKKVTMNYRQSFSTLKKLLDY